MGWTAIRPGRRILYAQHGLRFLVGSSRCDPRCQSKSISFWNIYYFWPFTSLPVEAIGCGQLVVRALRRAEPLRTPPPPPPRPSLVCRYHKAKFFDRRKALRRLAQIHRKLKEVSSSRGLEYPQHCLAVWGSSFPLSTPRSPQFLAIGYYKKECALIFRSRVVFFRVFLSVMPAPAYGAML